MEELKDREDVDVSRETVDDDTEHSTKHIKERKKKRKPLNTDVDLEPSFSNELSSSKRTQRKKRSLKKDKKRKSETRVSRELSSNEAHSKSNEKQTSDSSSSERQSNEDETEAVKQVIDGVESEDEENDEIKEVFTESQQEDALNQTKSSLESEEVNRIGTVVEDIQVVMSPSVTDPLGNKRSSFRKSVTMSEKVVADQHPLDDGNTSAEGEIEEWPNDQPDFATEPQEEKTNTEVEKEIDLEPKLGFTTEFANKKLITVVKETLNDHDKREKFRTTLFVYLRKGSTIVLIAGIALTIAAFIATAVIDDNVIVRLIVEFSLLIVFFFINVWILSHERKHQKHYIIQKARSHLEYFEKHGDPYQTIWLDSSIINSSMSTISVVRDNKWIKLPLNHLVEGDVVGLIQNEIAPVKLKCIEPEFADEILEPGKSTDAFHIPELLTMSHPIPLTNPNRASFNMSHSLSTPGVSVHPSIEGTNLKRLKISRSKKLLSLTERCRFVALETPAAKQIKTTIQISKGNMRKNPVLASIDYTASVATWILYISLLVSMGINLLRFFLQELHETDPNRWVNLLLLRQAYLCIPIIQLALSSALYFAWKYADAQLFALFHLNEKKHTSSGSATTEEASVDIESAENSPESFPLVRKYFWMLARDNNHAFSLTRTNPLVLSLANITVVCFVDKDGVLTEVNPQSEKIFLFDKEKEDGTVLELSKVSDMGLTFDDANWSEHLQQLKPLGLNALLNKNCKPLEAVKSSVPLSLHRLQCLMEREDPYNVYSRCLCSLGKEIGFSDDALDNFRKVKEIHTFFPKMAKQLTKKRDSTPPSSYLLSLVIMDQLSGNLQLLSRGSTDSVLDHCTSFWDGESIKQFTPEIKAKINAISNDWSNTSDVISLSYKPIDSKNAWLFSNKNLNPICIHLKKSESFEDIITIDEDGVTKPNKRFRNLRPVDSSSDLQSYAELSESHQKDENIRILQKNQIFIGMVALRDNPQGNLPKAVTSWRDAGIRFVFFSIEAYDNSSKMFASKIGLETDWNCCISLNENDNKQNYLNSNNVAFLPKGIPEIRAHLQEDVDNVPLLVPMFADATQDTTTEMFRIFQEYGDVVCCVGSSFNGDNTSIFAQADLAIGVEPAFKLCSQEEGKSEDLLPFLSSSNFIDSSSSKSFSCDINSLSCSLIMHRKSNPHDLVALMKKSRHLMVSIKQFLMFYLFQVCLLHFVLFFSYALWPSYFQILNGIQLLFLSVVIIPILSLCQLLNKREASLMDRIPSKNIKNVKAVRHTAWSLALLELFSLLILLAIFLRAMQSSWEGSYQLMFGRHGVEEGNYNYPLFYSALLTSQNIVMFAFTFHMCIYCLCFAYHNESIFSKRRMVRPIQFIICGVVMIIQLVWCIVSLATKEWVMDNVDWDVYVLVFAWPLLSIPINEGVKYRERKWSVRHQKELRLEFDTRLGKYSPK